MIVSRAINSQQPQMFCVFYVDIEGSTPSIAKLHPEKYAFYYSTFYDTLSNIALKQGGRVIKHVGDALIIYFPATSDSTNPIAFRSILECGMIMLQTQGELNTAYQEAGLPPLRYRISADYGRMEPIETSTSPTLDWIGPPMNMVAKMNRFARANSMIVGGDLHQILSKLSLQEYAFECAGELNIGIKQNYPIYSVARKSVALTNISLNQTIDKLVTLPSATTSLLSQTRAEAVVKPSRHQLPNVVIVDDEQDILLLYKRYLSGQPVNVEVFADPVQLLARLAEIGPSYYDLAIIDIRMPKITGLQIYQILTALKPTIQTLFVSALDYAGDILAGLRGIDKEEDFIRKPISQDDFVYTVNKKLGRFCTPRT